MTVFFVVNMWSRCPLPPFLTKTRYAVQNQLATPTRIDLGCRGIASWGWLLSRYNASLMALFGAYIPPGPAAQRFWLPHASAPVEHRLKIYQFIKHELTVFRRFKTARLSFISPKALPGGTQTRLHFAFGSIGVTNPQVNIPKPLN